VSGEVAVAVPHLSAMDVYPPTMTVRLVVVLVLPTVVILAVPTVVAILLRRTRVWWLPGIFAVLTFFAFPGLRETYGLVPDRVATIVMFTYAGLLLLLPFLSRNAGQSPRPRLPVARVVDPHSRGVASGIL
jgi:hypothetical protein